VAQQKKKATAKPAQAAAPPAEPKEPEPKQEKGDRDPTYEELQEYARSKGNGEKGSTIFAEMNVGNAGYVVRNGQLVYDQARRAGTGG
jgi:hypothetical protein